MTRLLQVMRIASVVTLLAIVAASQGGPTNILTNGDFSKGLSCYTQTPVGYTAGDLGDWLFYLSTDVDPGKLGGYSTEIFCPGPAGDCSKAHFATERIPVDSGMTYKLTTTYKCGSGSTADIQVYSNGNGNMYIAEQGLTCDGTWRTTPTALTFTPPDGFMEVSFDDFGADFLKVDNIKLTYLNGSVPNQTVLYGGNPQRAVIPAGSTYVKVDGNPYLALGFYDVPGSVSSFQSARADGANTVTTAAAPVTPVDKCFNTGQTSQQDYRDWAYLNHLNLLANSIYSVRTGYDNGTKGQNGTGAEHVMSSMISTYGTHFANIGWILSDEPDINHPTFNVTGAELTTLDGIATQDIGNQNMSLPLFTAFNHATWDPNFINLGYGGATDIWGAEPYGYSQWQLEMDNAIGAFTSIQLQPTRPMWFAFDGGLENGVYHPNIIVPQAYYAVVRGVTGILYFDWGAFTASYPPPTCPSTDPTCLLSDARQVFTELGALTTPQGGPLLAGSVLSGLTSQDQLPFVARSYQLQDYVIAVNTSSTQSYQGTFNVPNLPPNTTITVLFEGGRTFQSNTGSFTDPQGFATLTRHVYKWSQ